MFDDTVAKPYAGNEMRLPFGSIIYVDPYLSDCVSRMVGDMFFGFKRIMPPPIASRSFRS